MSTPSSTLFIIPVLPSSDIDRDLRWYEKHTGFSFYFGDNGYAGLTRENLEFHLQFHHNNEEDPISGESVMKIFVSDIMPWVEEFVRRDTISYERLQRNTPWGTHEFSFKDLNGNSIYIVQDV